MIVCVGNEYLSKQTTQCRDCNCKNCIKVNGSCSYDCKTGFYKDEYQRCSQRKLSLK